MIETQLNCIRPTTETRYLIKAHEGATVNRKQRQPSKQLKEKIALELIRRVLRPH